MKQRTYIAIDLKSFYASVECMSRGLDPLTSNLVVADASRTDKTICLAVSPSLKAYGISGRARLFEVNQRLKEVNYDRKMATYSRQFTGKSYDDRELKKHRDWEVDYIAAPPRMAHYIQCSTEIYNIYLQFIAAEDIHVYSIDEVFMDVTEYLATYKLSAHDLAMKMIQEVLNKTGITATAGIGTNLYLCKVAMDIVAKHLSADKDGVRIAELDEMSFRHLLWEHKPLTDFWRIGPGIANKLNQNGMYTQGDIARCSIRNEEILYNLFGINAELLIDHAWGWEPCTMEYIKAYHPETNSLSSGQVLTCPYAFQKARVVIQEMSDAIALDLLDKKLVTNQLILYVGYDRENLTHPETRAKYNGVITTDNYGRAIPKHAQGTRNLEGYTSSAKIIREKILEIYDNVVNPNLFIRRLNISVNHVILEERVKKKLPIELNLFTDYEEQINKQKQKEAEESKERKLQETLLNIKKKYGKNSILKGISYAEGATSKERNNQIGGHKA